MGTRRRSGARPDAAEDHALPETVRAIPAREECIRIAQYHSPEIRSAQQAVVKAKAGLGAAKDAYIPDITGLARYSYQGGIPFLVRSFGTFGVSFTYDLFDGGAGSPRSKIPKRFFPRPN